MDSLGLPFAGVCIIAWLCFVLLMARFCGRGERLAEAQRRAERREVDGPMGSVLDFKRPTRHGKGVV